MLYRENTNDAQNDRQVIPGNPISPKEKMPMQRI